MTDGDSIAPVSIACAARAISAAIDRKQPCANSGTDSESAHDFCDRVEPRRALVFLETFEPFMQRQNRRQEADVREGLGEVAQ